MSILHFTYSVSLESRIQESSPWNLESEIVWVESRIQDCLAFPDMGRVISDQ